MILVGTNLLVSSIVEEKIIGFAPVGFPWASLMGSVRITTNPRIFPFPKPVETLFPT